MDRVDLVEVVKQILESHEVNVYLPADIVQALSDAGCVRLSEDQSISDADLRVHAPIIATEGLKRVEPLIAESEP